MNLIHGFKDSLDLLAFRWGTIRKRRVKVIISLAFLAVVFMLYGLTSVGLAMRTIAANPIPGYGDQFKTFAITYVSGFMEGSTTLAVSGVLTAIIGSILIIPIVGYSFSSLTPSGDLVSVRRNDYYKLSDSIILQFLSSISIIQLFAITGLNSLLTISSPRPGLGIVYGWVLWVGVTLTTVFVAWLFEYLYRIFGLKSRVIAIGALIVLAGILALFSLKEAGTLFGLGESYGTFIKNMDKLTFAENLITGVITVAVLALIAYGISKIGSAALNLPERPKRDKVRKPLVIRLGAKKASLSQSSFLLNIIFRNANIWKPLALSSSFALISIIVLAGSPQVLSSLVFVIPLIVSLSWGVNTFGILGGGVTWLVSLPGGKEDILKNIAKIQFILVGCFFAIILLPTIIIYHIPFEQVVSFSIASLVSTIIMTRSALSKAVYQPERYRVHIKGENVLPPAKALNYLFRFIIGGGAVGVAVFYSGSILIQLGVLAVVIIWQSFRFIRLNNQWNMKPAIIENVIRSVGY